VLWWFDAAAECWLQLLMESLTAGSWAVPVGQPFAVMVVHSDGCWGPLVAILLDEDLMIAEPAVLLGVT